MVISDWFRHSPGRLAGRWFAGFRFVWAVYWFVIQPQPRTFAFKFVSGALPVILSTAIAFYLGSKWGKSILDPSRTRSYGMAAIRGMLIEYATTLLYLPVAALLTSLAAGEIARFIPSLYLSLIFSLAGIPIHAVLGALTGSSLRYASTKWIRPEAPI